MHITLSIRKPKDKRQRVDERIILKCILRKGRISVLCEQDNEPWFHKRRGIC